MKTIEIQFTRKLTFNKIVEVDNKLAKKLLSVDGEDLMAPTNGRMDHPFYEITENLTDIHDIYDELNEIENVSVQIYKPKK